MYSDHFLAVLDRKATKVKCDSICEYFVGVLGLPNYERSKLTLIGNSSSQNNKNSRLGIICKTMTFIQVS